MTALRQYRWDQIPRTHSRRRITRDQPEGELERVVVIGVRDLEREFVAHRDRARGCSLRGEREGGIGRAAVGKRIGEVVGHVVSDLHDVVLDLHRLNEDHPLDRNVPSSEVERVNERSVSERYGVEGRANGG